MRGGSALCVQEIRATQSKAKPAKGLAGLALWRSAPLWIAKVLEKTRRTSMLSGEVTYE